MVLAERLRLGQPHEPRRGRRGDVLDLDDLGALFERRQVDDQRASENRIRLVQMKGPAYPRGLGLRQGAKHVARSLTYITDVEIARIEHQLRGAGIKPLDLEGRYAEQHFVAEIDP